MKLIIQIPCLNERETLPATVSELPRELPGIDEIEYLVIDDGSTDGTAKVAHSLGVDHVLELGSNRGLAKAFDLGIQYALDRGADIIVNTDADNQYRGSSVVDLVRPILDNRADIVVGARPIRNHPEFGFLKKMLQRLGSFTLRWISRTRVADAASGFRAFSAPAARRIFLHSSFSHCIETLIQAGNAGLRVESVDIEINLKTRPSRLFGSVPEYLWKQGRTMLAMFVLYRPGRFFAILAMISLAAAFGLGLRFIYLEYLTANPIPERTYIPSLILLAILALSGILTIVVGIVAELIKYQRRLSEELIYEARLSRARGGRERLHENRYPKPDESR